MKSLFIIVLFTSFTFSFAQQKISFGYDSLGNQVSRVLCLSGCASKPAKEIYAIVDEDLQKFFPEDAISYYPNPVKEELYLKWELVDTDNVVSVVVYGMNGQILRTFSNTRSTNNLVISFQQYPIGVYIVALNYTNSDQKTIKIIKQ